MGQPKRTIPRTCEQCGTGFLAEAHNIHRGYGKFCSKPCQHASQKRAVLIPRTCIACSAPFAVHPYRVKLGQGVFCSAACRNSLPSAIRRKPAQKIPRNCELCSAPFTAWPFEVRKGDGRFCSRPCARRAYAIEIPNAPIGEPPICGVYAIIHTATGRAYVGSSKNIRQRWGGHRSEFLRNDNECRLLQTAWSESGADAFEWRILERVDDPAMLVPLEQAWMRRLDALTTGFNVHYAGTGYVANGRRKTKGPPLTAAQHRALELARTPESFTESRRRNIGLNQKRRLPDDKVRAVLADTGAPANAAAIARRHGISRTTVREILSGRRVPVNP